MTVDTPTDNPAQLQFSDDETAGRAVYLDSNATTPVDPRVVDEVMTYMAHEFGNAGSRTHGYGQVAKERVARAREQVAEVVRAQPDEVIFTSGATESNNLAILGLAPSGEKNNRRHIVSTQIEHKAVLEPLAILADRGFDVTLVPPTRGGWIEPSAIADALRPDTLLVSTMAVNNETGVIQPIPEIAEVLAGHDAYLHVDAAQAFGKIIEPLRNSRIDMLSVSGHKVFAPKGIGALMARRRGYRRVPLQPLMFGGGQERGLRPGTLPVALIAGLGLAAELALKEHDARARHALTVKHRALNALSDLGIQTNGDEERTVPHTLNFSVPGVDAEAAIVALKEIVAISNGSACTSQKYEPSHVLVAADLPKKQIDGALRFSWSHLTEVVPWDVVAQRLAQLVT
ncbi:MULTISPECIES: cysteine desulfurase DndA [Mycobacteroides]|uniref:cysteine desulfurase DndA n=1 Tax=Mycobacteroides TaxID=670516 RepID=UPI00094346D3|nr:MULTISPECIES: cysteine desulfurase DndA [Mycobacteroides]MBF9435255.1 cysteine desulfurase DndA [Mycobacteroides chelonae]MBN7507513.1 cysteine desulfurase DndA [Mycobacteroides abscessus subsp. massiliense]MDO3037431.1 cysteine desulfurase DndA [Mycobacteroides abscessus subsp. abscessus]MDO3111308.1 cysteine desulfurase DndA [Mycobacteroides abscessus subsp. massiliense]MDO3260457.1 cysteine desulfurase DndA [Mycobacteroides abscessus subsp. abscessus]